jgi:hypothetical protein
MDLIQQCFDRQNKDLMKRLIAEDFSIDQALLFLPVAALGLCLSCRKTSEFQTIACLFTKSQYQMLRTIDIDQIADGSGLEPEQVIAGLHAIAPLLLQAFAAKSNTRDTHSAITSTEELA